MGQAQPQAQTQFVRVPYQDLELIYEATNDAVIWRANTLYQKEPDTVAWISQFAADEVFIDIGANVGMYSVLAARGRGAQVFAFEPESQNFALLNRNIIYNQIQSHCTAFPLALANEVKVDRLYLSEFGLGGSCHTFGDNIDFHLRERNIEIAQGCVAFPLDQLVAQGVVPTPNHIKIDVDGLEHLVLEGAANVLRTPELKSVLVELNTHLGEHRALIEQMCELGFEFDPRQVELAIRQEGAFQGIGNYIFYRPDSQISFADIVVPESAARSHAVKDVKKHVTQRLGQLELHDSPFPYFCLENVFPADFYAQMMAMKPTAQELKRISETGRTRGYDERFVLPLDGQLELLQTPAKLKFWRQFRDWFLSESFMIEVIKAFQPALVSRGVSKLNVRAEGMFMRDVKGYEIGPHTDSPRRLLSLMFYLPDDDGHIDLGTSIYQPKEPGLECTGARHHAFENFEKLKSAPYLPNTMFGFLKTENSFHGVEQLTQAYERDTLVYIVKHKAPSA